MQKIKIFLTACTALVVSACSNNPPIVTSSLPLVKEVENTSSLLPQAYWQKLDAIQINDSFVVNNNVVIAEARYNSALGEECIRLSVDSNKRIVCKADAQGWKIVPNIVIDESNVELFN